MSCDLHGFPELPFAIPLYYPLLPADLLNYILCPNRAVEDKFLWVVQHLSSV